MCSFSTQLQEELTPWLPAETEEALLAQKARRSLAEFVRQGWEIVEPGTPLLWNWHIDVVCEHLQAVTDGRIKRLIINIPPGHMKSLIVSVFWPAWEWIDRPEIRTLFSSYAMDLALRDSVRCRDVVQSDWYRGLFRPRWKLKADMNAARHFENDRKGFRFSMSVGGRATGFRGDKIVCDDPLNAKEAPSDAARAECILWWDKVMPTRLNDPRTGAKVIIMQRLHEDDLTGHLLARGGYEHLCLPTEFEPDRRSATSIGWTDPRTEPDELLFPEMFNPEVLVSLKSELGSDGFAGQHQQRPSPAEGNIFKKAWFERRYKQLDDLLEVWTCWDTALKEKESNDESAFTVMGLLKNGDVPILRAGSGHWDTPDVEQFLVENADWLRGVYGDKYKGEYIEDKVSGTTLIRYIRRSRPDLAIIGVAAETDKEARAKGVTPMCEALRVVLPDPGIYPDTRDWVTDFLHQITTFPNGKFKDLTDTFVYGLMRVMGTLNRKGARRGRGGAV